MEFSQEPLGEITQKLRVEQTVREFLHILEQNQLGMQEGLVAWNMLGFTIFQELYPDESHEATHKRMIKFSEQLFYSSDNR